MRIEYNDGACVKEADKLESDDIINFLGGLPPQKHECALLACRTLKKALATMKN